jgi:hypothetical protein
MLVDFLSKQNSTVRGSCVGVESILVNTLLTMDGREWFTLIHSSTYGSFSVSVDRNFVLHMHFENHSINRFYVKILIIRLHITKIYF